VNEVANPREFRSEAKLSLEEIKVAIGRLARAADFIEAFNKTRLDDPNNLLNTLAAYHIVREHHRQAAEQLTRVHKALEWLSYEGIPALMDANNVRSLVHDQLGKRFQLSTRMSVSITGDETGSKEEGYKWLKDNGHGDLIKETVNAATLSAMARDLLEQEGFELPSHLFKTSVQTLTSVVDVGKKDPNSNLTNLEQSIKARATKARVTASSAPEKSSAAKPTASSRPKTSSAATASRTKPALPKRGSTASSRSSGASRTGGGVKSSATSKGRRA
jgi:hypothetical protein